MFNRRGAEEDNIEKRESKKKKQNKLKTRYTKNMNFFLTRNIFISSPNNFATIIITIIILIG
jgi:hypothetical protein